MFPVLKVALKPNLTRENRQSRPPFSIVNSFFKSIQHIELQCTGYVWEPSGSVVECLTRDREAAGSSLTGITALCPSARHINPSLVLVQNRKTRSYITEDCGWDVKNPIKQTKQCTCRYLKECPCDRVFFTRGKSFKCSSKR